MMQKEKKQVPVNMIEQAMVNRQIVFALLAMLAVIGAFALYKMPRQEFPEFTIRQGLVIGVFPGATSAKVEDQLTTKVENYLFGFNEVDKEKTYSLSRDHLMVIFVEVQKRVNHTENDAFWAKLRHGLNELKSDLPAGVMTLTANNEFGDTSAIILSVTSDTKTYKELETHMKNFENELRKLKMVSKIKHSGLQKEQIGVYIDDAKLALYGIKSHTLLAALKTEGAVNYAGELDNGKIILPITIPERYHSENDIAEQIIHADPAGNVIRLKDVAKIVREYGEPDSYITVNGKKSIIITLEMQQGNNIVHFGKEVDSLIKSFSKRIPRDITIHKIADMPVVVHHAVVDFLKEFLIAILSVILVTVVLLPRKMALIASITIPITILITLAILYICGIELQTVSLAALIVSLGMVVDDTMVVIDNHIEKLDEGISPWEAAWRSPTELSIAMLTATLAIISVFMPLSFGLSGMERDFIFTFPVSIAIALLLSFIIALFFTPIVNYTHIKEGIKKENPSRPTFLDRMQDFYRWTFERSFQMPKRSLAAGALAILLGLLLLLTVPRELYPSIERNQFAVEIYLPAGRSLEVTGRIAKQVEALLAKDRRIEMITAFVGSSSPRFHTTYAPNIPPSKNYAQLLVNTISNQATEEILNEYSKKYRNYFPEAYIRWKQLAINPTVAPIEVRIAGNSIPEIKEAAARVTEIMRGTENISWVRNNFEQSMQLEPSLQGLTVEVKKDEANRLGFTKSVFAYALAVGTKGLPLSVVWEEDYPVNIVLHVDKNKKSAHSDIMNQYITSPLLMSSVQLRQVAELRPEWRNLQIVRQNGVRTITVRADVERGVYASVVLKEIKERIEAINLPQGVKIHFGGEYEREIETYEPMAYAFTGGIIIIFFILLFQFKTIKTTLLVMSTMFFCFFGAGLGLHLMRFPFGFTAFVGFMGLTGLVVRNGIILVEFAESLRREGGMGVREAAISAGKRRLRPIFLTSAAASVGVIPMIISRSPLWGPLAAVICFGLMFAMIFTLYILPVLYMWVNSDEPLLPRKESYEKKSL